MGQKEQKHLEAMFDAFVFDRKIELKVVEIKEGNIFENEEFLLEAYELNHGVLTFGYNFIEKDKRRINVRKAEKFGLKQGPLMGKLQDGETVEHKGKKIKADDVTYVVKGKKISIIGDTGLCNNCYKMAEDADLLISESTYASDLEEKGEAYGHLTAKQAALIANKANVKKLMLTHLSARYKTKDKVEEDAKDYFANSEVAEDFKKIKL